MVAVGNAFCAFSKELVDAFVASTAPAASTAPRRRTSAALDKRDRRPRRECLDAPAQERRGRICAPARLSVRSLQWGVAPSSASTGVRESHGTSTNTQEQTRLLTAQWFVGIDWASEAHEVCVLDRDGHIVERRQVTHTVADLQAFVEALLTRAHGDPAAVAIGIEVPRGALVELLVERGFAVYAINPKQMDRFRDRFTPAGAKDDRRDALVIGDSLRTDPQAFRQVRLDHPVIIQLREWSRIDEDLGVELTRLTNQVRDLVYRSAPGLLALSPAADDPWLWALLRQAPTPAAQRRLSERRLDRLLRDHRIRRLTATQVREVLQQPAVFTAPGVVDAVAAHLQVLLPRVELIAAQRRDATRQLERWLEALETETASGGPARAFGRRYCPLHARDRDARRRPDARRGLAAAGRSSVSRAARGHGRRARHETERPAPHRLDAVCVQCAVAQCGAITGHARARSTIRGAARTTRRFAHEDIAMVERCAASRIDCCGF